MDRRLRFRSGVDLRGSADGLGPRCSLEKDRLRAARDGVSWVAATSRAFDSVHRRRRRLTASSGPFRPLVAAAAGVAAATGEGAPRELVALGRQTMMCLVASVLD